MRETLEKILTIEKENNAILRANNQMLCSIIEVLTEHIKRANQENMDDFGRNVVANLMSTFIESKHFRF